MIESRADQCLYCFRYQKPGEQVTEDSMQPDMQVVKQMLALNLRVQDLLDYLCEQGYRSDHPEISKLLDWYAYNKR